MPTPRSLLERLLDWPPAARRILVNGVGVKAPPSFAGILPARADDPPQCAFEPLAWCGLAACLRPGIAAFDVGASYGVFTTMLAKGVGRRGRVHAFEAHPGVIPWERELAVANGVAKRVTFYHTLVGDRSEAEMDFQAIPGFQSVASTRSKDISVFHSEAETIRVPMVALDDHVQSTGVTPDLIKIDIEGSEYLALTGARRLLASRGPDLVIETHGLEISGVGGNVAELCELLDRGGYSFFDLGAGEWVSAPEYAGRYREAVGYLLASRRAAEAGFVSRLNWFHERVRASC